MEKKFTTGDWFVSGGTEVVSMPSQCKISNRVSGWNYEESKANAKLIAAAPDMFDALECICKDKEVWSELSDTQKTMVEQAIKKATNERF